MEDDGEERYVVLHDPWCNADSESQPATAGKNNSIEAFRPTPNFFDHKGAIRLTWRDISFRFDTIHLSWNPGMFSRRQHVQLYVLFYQRILEYNSDLTVDTGHGECLKRLPEHLQVCNYALHH